MPSSIIKMASPPAVERDEGAAQEEGGPDGPGAVRAGQDGAGHDAEAAEQGAAQAAEGVLGPAGGLLQETQALEDQHRRLRDRLQELGHAAQELLEEVLRAELPL